MAFPKKNPAAPSGPKKPALTVKVRRGLAEAKSIVEASGRKIGHTTDLGTALAWIDAMEEFKSA